MWPEKKRDTMQSSEEDISREDIVSAFRSAMLGHFRSHVPGTNINESTLLTTDYLNHFHELVMLLEACSSEPEDFSGDVLAWKPLTYEQHFAQTGFRDKNLAIAAYHRAPPRIRARFDDAVAKLHGEAVTLVAEVASELGDAKGERRLRATCTTGAQRLRALIERANAIANGDAADDSADLGSQAAVDAIFGPR
jgi:hypothetical protein